MQAQMETAFQERETRLLGKLGTLEAAAAASATAGGKTPKK